MIKKQDNFPRNVVQAFEMLNRWKPTNRIVTDRYRPNTRVGHMYATTNILRNCRVTPDDNRRLRIIYGPALPTLKGKMVHTNPDIFDRYQESTFHPQ